ncbi:hypothetical protein AV654_19600 [Paenibacillus elgii]|uniref:Uncharacterized protein n=1 Tax=Paenibacillus elgii TaxID=189691 RepID=A0A163XNK4_9BACL|nr:hypothetical protein [Paenibacillus elgii]KZE78183.1 hypothetical protein AV654_19600 [Paenibacillus elgii]
MEKINLNTHYTIEELSIITGLEMSSFYAFKKELNLRKYILPSNRIGYGAFWKDFEDMLDRSRTYDFMITEYNMYYKEKKKRPTQRQFLDIKETAALINGIGDERSIFTYRRRVRENKIPAYALKSKNIIPIVYIIKLYALPIDSKLEQLISEIIKAPYTFKL